MPSTGVGGILVQTPPPGWTSPTSGGVSAYLQLQSQTPFTGTALINGTQTLAAWSVPQDGSVHWCMVLSSQHVTVNETGGLISVAYTLPDGAASGAQTIFPGGSTTTFIAPNSYPIAVGAGTIVTVSQSTALTVGAALVWVSIWGA